MDNTKFRIVALVVLLGLLLAGCGPSEEETAAQTATVEAQATATAGVQATATVISAEATATAVAPLLYPDGPLIVSQYPFEATVHLDAYGQAMKEVNYSSQGTSYHMSVVDGDVYGSGFLLKSVSSLSDAVIAFGGIGFDGSLNIKSACTQTDSNVNYDLAGRMSSASMTLVCPDKTYSVFNSINLQANGNLDSYEITMY